MWRPAAPRLPALASSKENEDAIRRVAGEAPALKMHLDVTISINGDPGKSRNAPAQRTVRRVYYQRGKQQEARDELAGLAMMFAVGYLKPKREHKEPSAAVMAALWRE